MRASEGLHPSSRGKRLHISGSKKTVIDDFGKELTPELRVQDERLRAEIERQRKS